jgi:AmmeMemoRadiSam system protein A
MSLRPENPLASSATGHASPAAEKSEYSPEERALLLKLARESIAAALERREISLTPPTKHLAEPRAAFTTLYYHGRLRGCVGHVRAVESLWATVADTARAAAFEDTRFDPVTSEEVPLLQVSLSILSPLKPIRTEQVEVGRHGLLISQHGRRGLLLPQVPVEYGWDRITFLEETCHKAGLPADAWRKGATLEAFTAEVFGDWDLQR